jgi:mercuric ion transport protein
MTNSRLLTIGFIGSILAAVCCFTPVLLIVFGVIGLSAYVGILDYVLLPALVIFPAITVYALWQRQQRKSN